MRSCSSQSRQKRIESSLLFGGARIGTAAPMSPICKNHNRIQMKQIKWAFLNWKQKNYRIIRENQLNYGLFYPNDLFHVKHGGRNSILFHVKHSSRSSILFYVKQNLVNWLCFTKKCSKLALFHVKQRSNERISFKTLRSSGNDEENQLFHVKHW